MLNCCVVSSKATQVKWFTYFTYFTLDRDADSFLNTMQCFAFFQASIYMNIVQKRYIGALKTFLSCLLVVLSQRWMKKTLIFTCVSIVMYCVNQTVWQPFILSVLQHHFVYISLFIYLQYFSVKVFPFVFEKLETVQSNFIIYHQHLTNKYSFYFLFTIITTYLRYYLISRVDGVFLRLQKSARPCHIIIGNHSSSQMNVHSYVDYTTFAEYTFEKD